VDLAELVVIELVAAGLRLVAAAGVELLQVVLVVELLVGGLRLVLACPPGRAASLPAVPMVELLRSIAAELLASRWPAPGRRGRRRAAAGGLHLVEPLACRRWTWPSWW
jgi:hypothetical protein